MRKKGFLNLKLILIVLVIVILVIGAVFFLKNSLHEQELQSLSTTMLQIQAKAKVINERNKVSNTSDYIGKEISEEDLKKLNIENLVINGMEDEPYFENNPFVLNKYASDILKITDKLINAFDIKNAYIAIKSNDTENINLFLSKIGTYTNINLSLIEDKYLLGSDFFLLENMNLKDNSLVISAQDLLSIYNSVVYLCDIDTTFITIASPFLPKSYVINVKIGTLLSDVFNSLNINIKENYLCIYNGLMTGYEVDYKKCIVTSNMKGVIIIPKFNEEEKPCNLCGMCYKICPVKVNPKNVMDTGKKSKNCIDCGLCTYICPCKINLRKYLRGQK